MERFLLLALMEMGLLVGGGWACLVGFRVYRGGGRVHPEVWERWYRSTGHWLRWFGPWCLLLALVLPVVFGVVPAPPWVPGAAALLLLGMALVFGVATWRWQPKVGWPRGFASWCCFLWLEPLCWSGVAMGVLDFLGFEGPPVAERRMWLWYLGGLLFARIVRVWLPRFTHRVRTGGP
ncbi:MAG: hypothetical protein ABIO70_04385 [Pseudomonadota bacterium]